MKRQNSELSLKIFADGADLKVIERLKENNFVKGFTTNPSLMRKAGVKDYRVFAEQALELIPDLPLSLEVLSDNLIEMEDQARLIASWGENIFVKIPIMTTTKVSTKPIIKSLSRDGIKVNVTAIMTIKQIKEILKALHSDTPTILSVFAGRIADTGRDPIPLIKNCVAQIKNFKNVELIWASPRELLNIIQAQTAGCDIITIGEDLLSKMDLIGKDLNEFSRETVEMFYKDAIFSKFKI